MNPANNSTHVSCPVAQNQLHLLIIDDNPNECTLYRQYLAADMENSYTFTECTTGTEGLEQCQASIFDCVLLDYRLPDFDGITLIDSLKGDSPCRLPIVVLTGAGNETIAADALRAGAADYLPKRQLSSQSLKRTIVNAVEKNQLRNAIDLQTQRLGEKHADLQRKQNEIQRFYHTVSHELKTPLTSIQEFTSILRDEVAGSINEEQREYLGIMLNNCQLMNNEINDLLDATRLETGKYRIVFEHSSSMILLIS